MKINQEAFEAKIRASIDEFKQGYQARDTKAVDQFIDRLFEKNDKTAVLGTSYGEWMMGISGAKELVESDWLYWGDVDINTEALDIHIFGETAFINMKGTVRYEFQYTQEKFERYLNFVKKFLDPAEQDYRMSPKAKAGHIAFILTHFNQIREAGIRENFYPLRINAVMTMQGDRAVFRFMKFSMDFYGKYPELRIDNQMMDMGEYYEQQKGFADECAKENRPEAKAAAESFLSFIKEDFNGGLKGSDALKEFLADKGFVVDTKGTIYKGKLAAGALDNLKDDWGKLTIDEKAIYADINGDSAWVVCNGLASRTISEEEAADGLMHGIQKILEKEGTAKDKLFAVQKQAADYFLQFSKGEYFLWPVRVAAMLVKEGELWKLYGMSCSYPYYYILEGKYDSVSMV